MSRLKLIVAAVSLAAALALAVACSSSEPTGATAEDIQAAMDAAVQKAAAQQQQPGVTQEDMAAAIAQAMASQEQGASAADVAAAVQSAMAAQPGVTQADVANAIASALAENQTDTEQQVADAIAQALRQQTPGLTEAEVSEAIARALAERPGVTQEDIQMAVQAAVAEAVVQEVAVPTLLKEGEGQTVDITTKPAYGGQLRLALHSDPGGEWDMCQFKAQHMQTHVVENFLLGDYNLGPSGEGLTTFQPRLGIGTDKLAVGALAESWEVPDPLTYSFRLRTGIRWQDKHPTFGRPVTAEEIATEINRIKECRWPRHDFLDDVTADDTDGDGVADTITHHTNQPISFWGYEFAWGPYFMSAPPESVEAGLDDPWNQSGTGLG